MVILLTIILVLRPLKRGISTKDSGEWNIAVHIDKEKVFVVHTRGELFMNGDAAFRWTLRVSNVAGGHLLGVLEAHESIHAHLLDVVQQGRAAAITQEANVTLPPLAEYMKRSYFDW